jgi:hypothetical protein
MNWRGKSLVSYETIVNLIAATTTKKGLKVRVELNSRYYPKGVKVTDEELKATRIFREDFQGEWNYSILPLKLNRPCYYFIISYLVREMS